MFIFIICTIYMLQRIAIKNIELRQSLCTKKMISFQCLSLSRWHMIYRCFIVKYARWIHCNSFVTKIADPRLCRSIWHAHDTIAVTNAKQYECATAIRGLCIVHVSFSRRSHFAHAILIETHSRKRQSDDSDKKIHIFGQRRVGTSSSRISF